MPQPDRKRIIIRRRTHRSSKTWLNEYVRPLSEAENRRASYVADAVRFMRGFKGGYFQLIIDTGREKKYLRDFIVVNHEFVRMDDSHESLHSWFNFI